MFQPVTEKENIQKAELAIVFLCTSFISLSEDISTGLILYICSLLALLLVREYKQQQDFYLSIILMLSFRLCQNPFSSEFQSKSDIAITGMGQTHRQRHTTTCAEAKLCILFRFTGVHAPV